LKDKIPCRTGTGSIIEQNGAKVNRVSGNFKVSPREEVRGKLEETRQPGSWRTEPGAGKV
jgi:hypothetical protein